MQPNIIFIVADDLGSSDLGCYGANNGVSPHLDRLAEEGGFGGEEGHEERAVGYEP